MTDTTITIADQTFTIKAMEDGQSESLFRIWRSIGLAGDADATFYARQLGRLGDLIDGLLTSEADVDRLDRLFLAGKVSTLELVKLILAAYNQEAMPAAAAPAKKAAKKAVAVTARKAVKKAPAKKAIRGDK
jgi:hypothetical protein